MREEFVRTEIYPPVDFSFKHISQPDEILNIQPRSGKRKILKTKSKKQLLDTKPKETTTKLVINRGPQQRKELEQKENKEQTEQKESTIEQKHETGYLGKAVRLNNNNLVSLKGLKQILDQIMEKPKDVNWLDLSFNSIKVLELVKLFDSNLHYFIGRY